MLLMYSDVKMEICRLMIFSFYIYIFVLLCPDDGSICGRNWSPFDKYIQKEYVDCDWRVLDCSINL